MRHNHRKRARRASTRLINAVASLSLVAWTTSCSGLLDVSNPGRVAADALNDPAMAPVLESAAIGNFQCALGTYIATAGVMSGELLVSTYIVSMTIWGWHGVEVKTAPGACPTTRTDTNLGFYTAMQFARYTLDDAAARIGTMTDAQVPNRSKILAEMAAYGGYAYTLLGEGMCDMTIDGGPRISRAAVLQMADDRFTSALALAQTAGDADLKSMALVGRARVRLDLGKLTDAAADAVQVPAGYVRNAEFSESRPSRENKLFNVNIRNDFMSVANEYRSLTVNGVPDARVKVVNTARLGQDAVTPQWQQQKYIGNGSAPIPIASWKEAQLILAEAQGGQAAKDAINRVRAAVGVAPLSGSEGTDVQALVMEERRRSLFLEGQRFGDMLRTKIPFPQGLNLKGQSWGPTTCMPLPDVETFNNPNLAP